MKDTDSSDCVLQTKHIGSVFDDEIDLLLSILEIYQIKEIELDPMYFKGNFYKGMMGEPRLKSDIIPQDESIKQADARHLEYDKNSIESMILDPPFMFNIHGKNGIQDKYYSSRTHGIFSSFRELSLFYQEILFEAYRILKKNGLLIFKCQDYTDSITTLTHCYVYQWAKEIGFKIQDIAILYKPNGKITNPNLTQRHLRKHHSYFMVFKK